MKSRTPARLSLLLALCRPGILYETGRFCIVTSSVLVGLRLLPGSASGPEGIACLDLDNQTEENEEASEKHQRQNRNAVRNW